MKTHKLPYHYKATVHEGRRQSLHRETARPTQERIKEHERDIRLTWNQTFTVFEHTHETSHYPIWNEDKFIDRVPHWCTDRVKEVIHIRLHPNNINRDNGIEIPEQHENGTRGGRPSEGFAVMQFALFFVGFCGNFNFNLRYCGLQFS